MMLVEPSFVIELIVAVLNTGTASTMKVPGGVFCSVVAAALFGSVAPVPR
jgi:hypothetical protein